MALTWLEGTPAKVPAVGESCGKMRELFERKLWHDLTEELLVVVKQAEWRPLLLELHSSFVVHFAAKCNPLSIASVLIAISRRIEGGDSAAALALVSGAADLLKQEQRPTELHVQAALLLRCEEVVLRLAVAKSAPGGLAAAKEKVTALIDEATEYTAKHEAQELPVALRAHIHRAQAEVHWVESRYNEYYRTCLLYLVHEKLDSGEVPAEEKQKLARQLGISALLGDEIHNFGELINNPITESLPESGHGWLLDLLRAFNSGDLEAYKKIAASQQRELQEHVGDGKAAALKGKMQLMALLHHIFITDVQHRTFTFEAIDKVCNTESVDDVEPLLLRALALGLIRGSIDEVDQLIEVTWIQSRVLGRDEIGALVGQIKQWGGKVSDTIRCVDAGLASHED